MNIHIGIPSANGMINASVLHSIEEARTSRHHRINYQCLGLSLLARNFNSLWISGYLSGADYFVLHHSDLAVHSPYPGVPWIDLLIERMHQTNAAVFSVASPIKSAVGNLSAGLDMTPGNPYSLRRLTVRELNFLPLAFIGRYDVCEIMDIDPRVAGAMIVNTGLIIMDLKRVPWFGLRWPGFRINDSIEWALDGKPRAYTEPEDWEASRWFHSHNIPYFMTREVRLHHAGTYDFTNQGIWGDVHDTAQHQPSIHQWHTFGVQK